MTERRRRTHRIAIAAAALAGASVAVAGAGTASAAVEAAMPTELPSAGAGPTGAGSAPAPRAGSGWVLASAYSAADGAAQGCPRSPSLRDSHLSVATPLVPCGHRMRVCTGDGRCIVVVRRDSGPYAGGRMIDLNVGVVRALGVGSVFAWGVRRVWWEPLGLGAGRRPGREAAARRGLSLPG